MLGEEKRDDKHKNNKHKDTMSEPKRESRENTNTPDKMRKI